MQEGSVMVCLQACGSYDQGEICRGVDRLLERLGGMEAFVQPGDRVLIKPNLLAAKHVSTATTTHPALVAEVAKRVARCGGTVLIADSPGGPYQKTLLKNLYRVCGIEQAARDAGAELNFDTSVCELPFPQGETAKSFSVIQPFVRCDKVVNLAKIKSHSMTYYTGAVKNLFGLVGGLTKAEYHLRYQGKETFCSMLVDLCECACPVLTILDGVMAMEGDGPSNGTPRKLGVLVGSSSPYLCDLAAVTIIGAKVGEVLPLALAIRRGLCPETLEGLLLGDPIERFMVSDFQFPETKSMTFDDHLPSWLMKLADKILLPYPKYDHAKCIGCMHCQTVCPAGALTKKNGFPALNKRNCIRCYCCQELCPKNAVVLKKRI